MVTKTYQKPTYLPTYATVVTVVTVVTLVTVVKVVTVVTVVTKLPFQHNFFFTKKVKMQQNSKTQNLTKLKNSSCDKKIKTTKLRM